jgi:hypothetical protein
VRIERVRSGVGETKIRRAVSMAVATCACVPQTSRSVGRLGLTSSDVAGPLLPKLPDCT